MNRVLSLSSFAVACVAGAARKITDLECIQNDHWVGALPYFDEAQVQPCSYAGTLPSNSEESHHMFYWMYPNSDLKAPVAIWLNGGPGASSTFSNFLMTGPMRVDHYGDGQDDYLVYNVDHGSWVDIATMIYIDQPVGTGFSWGDSLLTTLDDAADEIVYFLTNLFEKYPQLKDNDLYLTGESYAGKYLPRYAYALLEAGNFNLKAALVGDPFTAPMLQRTRMHIVPEALNILDDSNMPQIAALYKRCQEMMTDPYHSSAEKGAACSSILTYITSVTGDVLPYDARIFGYDWDKVENPVIDYFTISGQVEEIYKLIHVEDSTKRPIFQMNSAVVGAALSDDQLIDYSSYIEELIRRQLPFLVYAGEFDYKDGPKVQEFWLRRLNFEGKDDFWNQSRQVYYVDQPGSNQQIIGGYWRESQYFSYLTVPKAGHFVPATNYQPSFSLFQDYLNNKKLTCHNPDGCQVVSAQCKMMNQCSGNGSCQSNGQCKCNSGWKSADCSLETIYLVDGLKTNLTQYGPKYFSFTKIGAANSVLTLKSDLPMDIYISQKSSSDPTQFTNDIVFKQTKYVKLNSQEFDVLNTDSGYSVTCYSQSFDENQNTFFQNNLQVSYAEISSDYQK